MEKLKREGMIEFSTHQKLLWRNILSHLDFEEFFEIAQVCKGFLFLLKEDNLLWAMFVRRTLRIDKMPENCKSWKETFFEMRSEWDETRFEGRFEVDQNDKSILKHIDDGKNWKTALTKNDLIEGVLYPFRILHLPDYNLTIGVARPKTILGEQSFGVDAHRFGYYYYNCDDCPSACTNENGLDLTTQKNFEKDATIYILVHRGSYNQHHPSKATISFFNKSPQETQPSYQFSFGEISLDAGEKLVAFTSSATKGASVKIEKPIYSFDRNLLPTTENLVVHDETGENLKFFR